MSSTLALVATFAAVPPQLLSVTITDSLESSVQRVVPGHEGAQLAAEAARLLRWRGDLNRQVQRGDTLRMLYRPGDTEPEMMALTYAGEEIKLRAYHYSGADGIPRYYDEKGILVEPVMVNAPVTNYVQITETVQHGRGKRRHRGDDLKAPEGTPIRLPFPGTVVRTNWFRRVNGNCIEVRYDNGRVAHFLHLSHIAPEVRAGSRLEAGASLGAVGTTGHSNAAHLHYEILADGTPLEPLSVHGRRVGHVDAGSMSDFTTNRDATDRALDGPGQSLVAASPSATSPEVVSTAIVDCVPVSIDPEKPLGCKP